MVFRIRFPNRFGYPLVTEDRAQELQSRLGFSDAYRRFLVVQNGLVMDKLENSNDPRLVSVQGERSGHSDLRVLYGADSGDYYSLENHLSDCEPFAVPLDEFLRVGQDPSPTVAAHAVPFGPLSGFAGFKSRLHVRRQLRATPDRRSVDGRAAVVYIGVTAHVRRDTLRIVVERFVRAVQVLLAVALVAVAMFVVSASLNAMRRKAEAERAVATVESAAR